MTTNHGGARGDLDLPDELTARSTATDIERQFLDRATQATAMEEDVEDRILAMLQDRFKTHDVSEDDKARMDGVRLAGLQFASNLVDLGCHRYESFGKVIEDLDRAVQDMNASIARGEK